MNDKELIEVCKECGANIFCPKCGINHKNNTFWCIDCNDEEIVKENVALKATMQKSDQFRSGMVDENINLKAENTNLKELLRKQQILAVEAVDIGKEFEAENAELKKMLSNNKKADKFRSSMIKENIELKAGWDKLEKELKVIDLCCTAHTYGEDVDNPCRYANEKVLKKMHELKSSVSEKELRYFQKKHGYSKYDRGTPKPFKECDACQHWDDCEGCGRYEKPKPKKEKEAA